jgi:hypothetical protein
MSYICASILSLYHVCYFKVHNLEPSESHSEALWREHHAIDEHTDCADKPVKDIRMCRLLFDAPEPVVIVHTG